MKKDRDLRFGILCFCVAACFVVLSLLDAIHLAAAWDETRSLKQELTQAEAEYAALEVEYERMLDLREIEERAARELGMQHCTPGQIVYMELPKETD